MRIKLPKLNLPMTLLLIAALGAIVLSLLLPPLGCAKEGSCRMQMQSSPPALAHGGTTTVNGAAFDAMFFRDYGVNPFVDADEDNLSTFAMDVDTGSYTLCRSYLQRDAVPPKEAVRVEEFLNYFDYDYQGPRDPGQAFAMHLAGAPSKFAQHKVMLRVGVKARSVDHAQRKPAVLTFVIDVSGSMDREDRLGLVKQSLRLLIDALGPQDSIGIAVYGSRGRKLLEHCSVEQRERILKAIEQLVPDGATNAEDGLRIGYAMAAAAYREEAINRVVLCSDGVANVGNTGPENILRQIEQYARNGMTLSTLGFGMGNYNDVLMEQLADNGDGHYVYIDTLNEARRVFVENLISTIQVVARDAKLQVEFNPEVVRSYRLIGYENRDLDDVDFRNDKVDGGEVGAGHAVTALYEVKLWPRRDGNLATVRARYRDADSDQVVELSQGIATGDIHSSFDAAESSLRLAACVAEFAEIMRDSYWARGHSLDSVLELAQQLARGKDNDGDLGELLSLIQKAQSLRNAGPEELASSSEH